MTYEEKSGIVISQLREDRDRLQEALDKIKAEIKAASHGKRYVGRVDGKTEEVLLMDEVMEIIDKYRKGEK
jgi:hypothetical protein